MNTTKEVWLPVPNTGWRFEVSNHGHVMQLGRNGAFGRKAVFGAVAKPLVCDYKTEVLGWHLWFDNEMHFFKLDDLMALFGDIPVEIDPAEMEAARERRRKTMWSEEKRKAKTGGKTT